MEVSSLEDLLETPDSPEEKSSSTPMVDGGVMEVVPSQEKTQPKSIDQEPMPSDVYNLTFIIFLFYYKNAL